MTTGYHTLRELQEQAVLQNREVWEIVRNADMSENCLLYTSPSPRDRG